MSAQKQYLPLRLAITVVVVLMGAATAQLVIAGTSRDNSSTIRLAPGDDKTGYEKSDYQTDSLSLEYRSGSKLDLVKHAKAPHVGLPPLPTEISNRLDTDVVELGRQLFFDRRLSKNKTMSCAMCHIPEQGFSNNELSRPIGFEGRSIKRNAPTILNIAHMPILFWDAREFSLVQQAWAPLLASNEMNNASVGVVINTITSDPSYVKQFKAAFAESPNMLNIGEALSQYQTTLIAANSRFDRWFFQQDNTLSATELHGFKLFSGKAACVQCHTLNADHALFTDGLVHNTGVGYQDSILSDNKKVKVQLAPGVTTEITRTIVNQVGDEKPNDLGRYEVTGEPDDRWKFRTPSLRNIALTAPYMHNGEFVDLESVIAFYNQGGVANELLSPMIKELNLTKAEQQALVAFLQTLTSDDVSRLVSDAFTAPVGDTK